VRIFLSYAREDGDVAKRVQLSLRSRGHKVFFDDANIGAGSNYEKIIESEVKRSSVFVFLASSFSLGEGRFTHTELKLAEKKWPVAANHVLPVIIDDSKIEDFPPYLRSVSVLKPIGDVAAETAIAVQGLSNGRGSLRTIWRKSVFGSATLALIAGAIFITTLRPILAVSVNDPVRLGQGFFTDDARHMVSVTIENSGQMAAEQVAAHLEVRSRADGLTKRLSPSEARGTVVPQALVPDGRMSTRFDVLEIAVDDNEWRACASREGDSAVCTEFTSWETPALVPEYGRLDAPLREQVVDFAVSEDAVFLLLSTGNLVRMTDDGSSRAELTGRPVALSASSGALYVATSTPNRIERFDPATLDPIAESNLSFPENSFGEPVSTTPDVIVPQDGGVWIITRGNESENGLVWKNFNATSSQSSVPTFYEDLAFDLPGIDPHAFDFGVVSGSSDTTPATLWVWNPSNLWTFGGHDYEVVSCAYNVAAEGPHIYVPDCDGNLVRLRLTGIGEDRGIQKVDDLGRIEGYGSDGETWPEFDFHVLDSGAVVAAVALTRRGAWGGKSFSTVIGVNSEKNVVRIDQVRDARVLKIQSRGNRVWFLLESADGSARELVWLDLEA
jgi:hypothetical protein